jgi:AraC-like DNA-binding protein
LAVDTSSAELPALPRLPLALSAIVSDAFKDLRIGVSIWADGVWRAIYLPMSDDMAVDMPRVVELEVEHGKQPLRHFYNVRALDQVQKTGKPFEGEHAGFRDLFIPIEGESSVRAVLVVGPFTRAPLTAAEIRANWQSLTQAQARLTDPKFQRYLSSVFATPTFAGKNFELLLRLLGCFAKLLGGARNSYQLASEVDLLKSKFGASTFAEGAWQAAQSMVDERLAHTWSMPLRSQVFEAFRMQRPPRHAIAAHLVAMNAELDPIEVEVRRDALLRACLELALKRGGTASGKIGSRGVTFLSCDVGSGVRGKLVELATRAGNLARRFGFRLHAGIAEQKKSESLVERYRAALGAAEKALAKGSSLEFATAPDPASAKLLRRMRAEFASSVEGRSALLSVRFNRYIEVVLAQSGYQLEVVRGELESGLERLLTPLLSTGVLDEKGFDELLSQALGAGDETRTVTGTVESFRKVVSDVEALLQRPTSVRQERSMRRALSFVNEHLPESLGLAQVARVAGFAPDYFSRLLKREQGVTFEQYLQAQRLERSRQLLIDTELSVQRIAQLSGFKSRTTFQNLFRRTFRSTPADYRAQARRKAG